MLSLFASLLAGCMPGDPPALPLVAEVSRLADDAGFPGPLDNLDGFGRGLSGWRPLDAGPAWLAVGAPFDDDGGSNRGALWTFPLAADGTAVASEVRKLSALSGLGLENRAEFGASVCVLGDLDGDDTWELAVGAPGTGVGGPNRGGVWIVSLASDGSWTDATRLDATTPLLAAELQDGDRFGSAVCALPDRDGDGRPELLVSAFGADGGGADAGAVFLCSLAADGTLTSLLRVDASTPGLSGSFGAGDRFGSALAAFDDLDGDGRAEWVVGLDGYDGAGAERGAVWVLSVDVLGTAAVLNRLDASAPGLLLEDRDRFGAAALAWDPGRRVLAIGAPGHGPPGATRGAIWWLELAPDGALRRARRIRSEDGLPFALADRDSLGSALASPGDLDGDGLPELFAAAPLDAAAGHLRGAVWALFPRLCGADASAQARNPIGASGPNPNTLVASTPVLGETWTASIDLLATGHSCATVLGYAGGTTIAQPGGQVLLLDLAAGPELFGLPLRSGATADFEVPVPFELALCGATLTVQAAHLGGVRPYALSNAFDMVCGW